jgi:hypothetical protein
MWNIGTTTTDPDDNQHPQPDLSHSSHAHLDWFLDDITGWVICRDCQSRLVWLAAPLRKNLLRPENIWIINKEGLNELKFSGALFGQQWADIYIGQ